MNSEIAQAAFEAAVVTAMRAGLRPTVLHDVVDTVDWQPDTTEVYKVQLPLLASGEPRAFIHNRDRSVQFQLNPSQTRRLLTHERRMKFFVYGRRVAEDGFAFEGDAPDQEW